MHILGFVSMYNQTIDREVRFYDSHELMKSGWIPKMRRRNFQNRSEEKFGCNDGLP